MHFVGTLLGQTLDALVLAIFQPHGKHVQFCKRNENIHFFCMKEKYLCGQFIDSCDICTFAADAKKPSGQYFLEVKNCKSTN